MSVCFVMVRRPPRSTRTYTLFPYTTLVRSGGGSETTSCDGSVSIRLAKARSISTAPASAQSRVDSLTGTKAPFSSSSSSSRISSAKVSISPPCGSGLRRDGGIQRVVTVEDRQEAAHFHDRSAGGRSEEHTSELQSLMRISYAVFCLKKKTPT